MAAPKKSNPKLSEIRTPENLEKICKLTSEGKSAITISKILGIAYTTMREWIDNDPDNAAKYARAKQDQGDYAYEQIQEVELKLEAGILDPQTSRVLIDSIKWRAGKMRPKVYGEKLELSGNKEAPLLEIIINPVSAFVSVQDRQDKQNQQIDRNKGDKRERSFLLGEGDVDDLEEYPHR